MFAASYNINKKQRAYIGLVKAGKYESILVRAFVRKRPFTQNGTLISIIGNTVYYLLFHVKVAAVEKKKVYCEQQMCLNLWKPATSWATWVVVQQDG